MMKKLALGALFAGLAAACGGGSNSTTIVLPDSAAADMGSGVCNPLAQTGCNAGEKCNWIYDQLMPTVVGHIGCEPDGTVAIGGSCGARAIGPDTCVKGAECVSGECKQICDHQGGDPMCDANHSCSRYQNLFVDGTTTVAGVCDPGCDPLTQDLKVGTNKVACGSPSATAPVLGCYGYETFSCSGVAPTVPNAMALTLTDRVPPAGNYLNACAPGFMVVIISETGSTTGVCSGLCAALETDNTTTPNGGHVGNAKGDATASGKLPTSAAAAVGDATCNIGKKGSEATSVCKFLWPYNVDDAGMLLMTDYTDKLGLCFGLTHYKYDSNGDGALTAADENQPNCNTKPPRSATTTLAYDDAADFGCQKVANSMFTSGPLTVGSKIKAPEVAPELKNIHVGTNGSVPLARHVFN